MWGIFSYVYLPSVCFCWWGDFKVYGPFLVGYFSTVLRELFLYIWDNSPLSSASFANIFLQSMACLLILLALSFIEQKEAGFWVRPWKIWHVVKQNWRKIYLLAEGVAKGKKIDWKMYQLFQNWGNGDVNLGWLVKHGEKSETIKTIEFKLWRALSVIMKSICVWAVKYRFRKRGVIQVLADVTQFTSTKFTANM